MATRVSMILDNKGADVATIAPDATISEAVEALRADNIGALVVSPDGQAVEGILSERDIVRRLAEAGTDCLDLRVAEVMTTEVATCRKQDTADELMALMTSRRFRHLPVVEDGALAGIISIGDVVKSRIDQLETEAESLKEYVTGSAY